MKCIYCDKPIRFWHKKAVTKAFGVMHDFCYRVMHCDMLYAPHKVKRMKKKALRLNVGSRQLNQNPTNRFMGKMIRNRR